MLNTSCAQLDLADRDVHLRGQLTGTFNSLLVSMTMATSMTFGPRPGQVTRHPITSSLLTYQRSACNQTVCVVPATCSYTGNKVISTTPTLWEYDFVCICGQAWCNELLIWFHPTSVHGQLNSVALCEVGLLSTWFMTLYSCPHLMTAAIRHDWTDMNSIWQCLNSVWSHEYKSRTPQYYHVSNWILINLSTCRRCSDNIFILYLTPARIDDKHLSFGILCLIQQVWQ